jgi:hypothetical protein
MAPPECENVIKFNFKKLKKTMEELDYIIFLKKKQIIVFTNKE